MNILRSYYFFRVQTISSLEPRSCTFGKTSINRAIWMKVSFKTSLFWKYSLMHRVLYYVDCQVCSLRYAPIECCSMLCNYLTDILMKLPYSRCSLVKTFFLENVKNRLLAMQCFKGAICNHQHGPPLVVHFPPSMIVSSHASITGFSSFTQTH